LAALTALVCSLTCCVKKHDDCHTRDGRLCLIIIAKLFIFLATVILSTLWLTCLEWQTRCRAAVSDLLRAGVQKVWDAPVVSQKYEEVLSAARFDRAALG